jgi:hypothetical protein
MVTYRFRVAPPRGVIDARHRRLRHLVFTVSVLFDGVRYCENIFDIERET